MTSPDETTEPDEPTAVQNVTAPGGSAYGASRDQIIINTSPHRRSPTRGFLRILIAFAIAGAVIFVALTAYRYWLNNFRDIQITGDPAFPKAKPIGAGETLEIRIAGYQPRSTMRLTFGLRNPSPVGNCVDPATVEVVPIVDGNELPPQAFRPGAEDAIPLPREHRVIVLKATLNEPDRECRVEMTVSNAILQN